MTTTGDVGDFPESAGKIGKRPFVQIGRTSAFVQMVTLASSDSPQNSPNIVSRDRATGADISSSPNELRLAIN